MPGRTLKPEAGSTLPEPSIAIGTIGTPACNATWNAPPLNGPTEPSRLRVPSGNAHRLSPARTSATTPCRRWAASRAWPRSMNTMPMARAYQPMNGTLASSCLITKRIGTGRARNSAQMSIMDWWLATKTCGFEKSTCCSPVTRSFAPAPTSRPGAHSREAIRNGMRRLPPVSNSTSSARVMHPADHPMVKTSCTMFHARHPHDAGVADPMCIPFMPLPTQHFKLAGDGRQALKPRRFDPILWWSAAPPPFPSGIPT